VSPIAALRMAGLAPGLVRSSCEAVAFQAANVHINTSQIEATASIFTSDVITQIRQKAFDTDLHYVDGTSSTAQYLLVLDAINFCFWPDSDLEYEHIAKGIKASVTAESNCINATALASIDGPGLRKLVGWPRALPLEAERARLLREVGRVLCDHFEGEVSNLIRSAQGSAAKLVDLVAQHFPGFRDHGVYKGQQVFLYKRAQIWVGDVWGAFGGRGLGDFHDIDQLTMFADYRVPVTLAELGILSYSPELLRKIEDGEQLMPGSEMELEIRACTVAAVERLRDCLLERHRELMQTGRPLNSVLLDWWLWEEGEKKRSEQKHHRTLTIYY